MKLLEGSEKVDNTTKRSTSSKVRRGRPALTPEACQNQMISLATNLARKQLEEGTASSQVITHFLKLGTVQAQLELEKSRRETELLIAKTEAMKSNARMEELYENAIKAMQVYGGHGDPDDE